MDGVEQWLKDNLGIILGVCTGVAVIEVKSLPGMNLYCLIMVALLKAKLFSQVIVMWFNGSAVLALGCVCLDL